MEAYALARYNSGELQRQRKAVGREAYRLF
jgi:hypothetical protein